MRVAGALVLAGVTGFLLGACGGGGGAGSALTTRTGLTATRAQPTVERPTAPAATEATEAAPTVATTTVEVTTTETTRPPVTLTVTPPTTATLPATTTAPPVVAPTTTAAAAEPASSSETPWGWIALVLALAGVAVLGVILWNRNRSRSASWSSHLADLRRRTLITLDDVLASGSVVTGRVEALAAEARDLERHAGDDQTKQIAPVRASLDELGEALEADRTLRLASPPPSPDQLTYSDALIRQQVERLREVLRSA